MRLMKMLLLSACLVFCACGAEVKSDDAGTASTGTDTTTGTDDGATDDGTGTDTGGDLLWDGGGINVGETITDFALKDCEKNEVVMSSLVQGKKVLMLDFGAGWCVACREAAPHLQKLYEQYGDCLGIVTILNQGDEPTDPATTQLCTEWKAWCGQQKEEQKPADCAELTFPIVTDPLDTQTTKFLDNGALPLILLVDPDGKILVRSVGESAEVDNTIEALCGG